MIGPLDDPQTSLMMKCDAAQPDLTVQLSWSAVGSGKQVVNIGFGMPHSVNRFHKIDLANVLHVAVTQFSPFFVETVGEKLLRNGGERSRKMLRQHSVIGPAQIAKRVCQNPCVNGEKLTNTEQRVGFWVRFPSGKTMQLVAMNAEVAAKARKTVLIAQQVAQVLRKLLPYRWSLCIKRHLRSTFSTLVWRLEIKRGRAVVEQL